MERQHNALSDELWGDELSLAKVRVFWVRAKASFVFFWGRWNIQQRFTKKQQGTNKNSGTIIGFLKVELISLWKSQMVSAQGERNYGNLKVQGCSMLVFFYFVEQRRNGPMTFSLQKSTKKNSWNLRLGGHQHVEGSVRVPRCFYPAINLCTASIWSTIMHHEDLYWIGNWYQRMGWVSCYVCASPIFWQWAGKSRFSARSRPPAVSLLCFNNPWTPKPF